MPIICRDERIIDFDDDELVGRVRLNSERDLVEYEIIMWPRRMPKLLRTYSGKIELNPLSSPDDLVTKLLSHHSTEVEQIFANVQSEKKRFSEWLNTPWKLRY